MCSRVVVAVSAFTELSVNVFACGGGSVSVYRAVCECVRVWWWQCQRLPSCL